MMFERLLQPVSVFGCDQKGDLRWFRKKLMNLILEKTIGVGHPFPQMQEFKPGRDVERLQDASPVGCIFKHAPGKPAVALALVSDLLEGLEERRVPPDATRYSTITSTGPLSLSTFSATLGVGQCIEGERSISRPA